MFPAGNRWPRRTCLAAAPAVAALASGCGQPAGSQTIPDEPPAHPRCGAPVRALCAPQLQRAYGLPPARVTIISYGRVTHAAAHGAEGWRRGSLPGCRR